jgi:hypothetical protein
MIAAVVLAVSPLGQEVLHGAFVSGEQLSRSIAQFVLQVMIAIVTGLALIEWLVRTILARRRAKRPVTADGKTES